MNDEEFARNMIQRKLARTPAVLTGMVVIMLIMFAIAFVYVLIAKALGEPAARLVFLVAIGILIASFVKEHRRIESGYQRFMNEDD